MFPPDLLTRLSLACAVGTPLFRPFASPLLAVPRSSRTQKDWQNFFFSTFPGPLSLPVVVLKRHRWQGNRPTPRMIQLRADVPGGTRLISSDLLPVWWE